MKFLVGTNDEYYLFRYDRTNRAGGAGRCRLLQTSRPTRGNVLKTDSPKTDIVYPTI